MIKYRPEWCPNCKYYIPQRGATSPKCLNKNEVFIGESVIKCYAYTHLRIRSYTELKPNTIYNPYDEFEASERLAYHAHEEAVSANNKWWIKKVEKCFDNVMNCAYGNLKCEVCPDFYKDACSYNRWQTLKEQLEANNEK
jgi:hypothetical protein